MPLALAWEMWQTKADIPLWMPWISSVTVRKAARACFCGAKRSAHAAPHASLRAAGADGRREDEQVEAVHGAVRADAGVCVARSRPHARAQPEGAPAPSCCAAAALLLPQCLRAARAARSSRGVLCRSTGCRRAGCRTAAPSPSSRGQTTAARCSCPSATSCRSRCCPWARACGPWWSRS